MRASLLNCDHLYFMRKKIELTFNLTFFDKMPHYTTEQSTKMLHFVINDMRDKETTFTYRRDVGRMSCLTNDDIKSEMKRWRQLKKEDKLVIQPCNSYDIKIKGKDWFILTVQACKDNDIQDVGIDPIGLAVEVGVLVTGYLYFFNNKSNRDATQTYVMKN